MLSKHLKKGVSGLLCAALAGLTFLFLPPAPAFADLDNAGNVIAARRDAWAERGKTKPQLYSKSPIYSGDRLSTNPVGRLQVLFNDDSVLMLAPDSQATITEYVYAGESGNSFNISLAKGVTNLISGRMVESEPGSMKVETPEITVGIQGTALAVQTEGGVSKVMIAHATPGKPTIVVCGEDQRKTYLQESGMVLIMNAESQCVPEIRRMTADERFFLRSLSLPLGGPEVGETGSPANPAASPEPAAPILTAQLPQALQDTDGGSIMQPDIPQPAPQNFAGTYSGGITGSTRSSSVMRTLALGDTWAGDFNMSIDGLNSDYKVSGFTMNAYNENNPAGEYFSVEGGGDKGLAVLNKDGSFTLRGSNYPVAGNPYDDLAFAPSDDLLTAGADGITIAGQADGAGRVSFDWELLGINTPGYYIGGQGNNFNIGSANFSGTYSGGLTGSGTLPGGDAAESWSGNFSMSISGLDRSYHVSSYSMEAFSEGRTPAWAYDHVKASGGGDSASLNSNGTFEFALDNIEASEGFDAAPGDLGGTVKGNAKNNQGGVAFDWLIANNNSTVISGQGGTHLPSISLPNGPNFSGTYSGGLSGSDTGGYIGTPGDAWAGNFKMTIADLATSAYVSDFKMEAFSSESNPAWDYDWVTLSASGGTADNPVATLGTDGSFSMTSSNNGGTLSMDYSDSFATLAAGAKGWVEGTARENNGGVDFTWIISDDYYWTYPDGIVAGTGSTTRNPVDFPATPNFSGTYSGGLTGAYDPSTSGSSGNWAGKFDMSIQGLDSNYYVSDFSMTAFHEDASPSWGAARVTASASGGTASNPVATLNRDGSFSMSGSTVNSGTLTVAVLDDPNLSNLTLGTTLKVEGSIDESKDVDFDWSLWDNANTSWQYIAGTGSTSMSPIDFPSAPAFAGTYSGGITGASTGSAPYPSGWEGNFSMTIAGLNESASITSFAMVAQNTDISTYQNNIAIYGSGGTINAKGKFLLTSDSDLQVSGWGEIPSMNYDQASVDGQITAAGELEFDWLISNHGDDLITGTGGTGLPAISVPGRDFSGTYSGGIQENGYGFAGNFEMEVGNLASNFRVNNFQMDVFQTGSPNVDYFKVETISPNGNMPNLDRGGNFSFNTATQPNLSFEAGTGAQVAGSTGVAIDGNIMKQNGGNDIQFSWELSNGILNGSGSNAIAPTPRP